MGAPGFALGAEQAENHRARQEALQDEQRKTTLKTLLDDSDTPADKLAAIQAVYHKDPGVLKQHVENLTRRLAGKPTQPVVSPQQAEASRIAALGPRLKTPEQQYAERLGTQQQAQLGGKEALARWQADFNRQQAQENVQDFTDTYKRITGKEPSPDLLQAFTVSAFGGDKVLPSMSQANSLKVRDEYQNATLGLRQAQQALDKAKFDASQNPRNPLTRIKLQQAQAEAERAHAYWIRAQAGVYGSVNGTPLPGASLDNGGQPVGSTFSTNFRNSKKAMAQLNDAQGAIKQVRGAVQKLYSSGSSLNDPVVAQALANHEWTSAQYLQGIAGRTLSPEQRNAVVTIKSAQENIQGMRSAAGGGLSNEQVNRLEAQLPGASTPNAAYANKQLDLLDATLGRLSQGVPAVVGGDSFDGAPSKGLAPKKGQPGKKHLTYNPATGTAQ